jgi:hypothetical protein
MKFYFCETCGKRITDEHVRGKGLKGWYCSGCAEGRVFPGERQEVSLSRWLSGLPFMVQPLNFRQ